MDRFIVPGGLVDTILQAYLKSNMDRFIENSIIFIVFSFFKFKIQYG